MVLIDEYLMAEWSAVKSHRSVIAERPGTPKRRAVAPLAVTLWKLEFDA